MILQTTVNRTDVHVDIEPNETLAELLRERLRLTGTKVSCDVEVCGSCTVLLDGLPVSACTTLAYEARGRRVLTIEGLRSSDGSLHPLQTAFLAQFALQCGFCTPGMIMSALALLHDSRKPTRREIIRSMDGNLCRCTGYAQIIRAIEQASVELSETDCPCGHCDTSTSSAGELP